MILKAPFPYFGGKSTVAPVGCAQAVAKKKRVVAA
jgi:hypothetical protein